MATPKKTPPTLQGHAVLTQAKAAAALADAKRAFLAAQEAEVAAKRLEAEGVAAAAAEQRLGELAAALAEYPGLRAAVVAEVRGRWGVESTTPDGAAMKAAVAAVWETVADRCEELESSDLVAIDERDADPLEQWQPTRAEFEMAKRVFFDGLFAGRPKPAEPVASAPGSPGRVADMAARHARGEGLFHDGDATPASTGKRLVVTVRDGGSGGTCPVTGKRLPPSPQVLGWEGEAAEG